MSAPTKGLRFARWPVHVRSRAVELAAAALDGDRALPAGGRAALAEQLVTVADLSPTAAEALLDVVLAELVWAGERPAAPVDPGDADITVDTTSPPPEPPSGSASGEDARPADGAAAPAVPDLPEPAPTVPAPSEPARLRQERDRCRVDDLGDGRFRITSLTDGRQAVVSSDDYRRDARPLFWLERTS